MLAMDATSCRTRVPAPFQDFHGLVYVHDTSGFLVLDETAYHPAFKMIRRSENSS
jgi:hypothetical protein